LPQLFGKPLLLLLICADALELRQYLAQHRFQRRAVFRKLFTENFVVARSFRRVSIETSTHIAIFLQFVFVFCLLLFFRDDLFAAFFRSW